MMNRFAILPAILLFACATKKPQPGFETADEAARQIVQALRTDNLAQVEEFLGEGSAELLHSGDDVADTAGRAEFVRLYDEKHRLEPVNETTMTLCIGEIDWPVPIPIVKSGDVWVFDTAAGLDEMLNRRIGRNELNAIQVCLAYCDAQREYESADRDGDGILEYAQKFRSSPDMRDGLYWPVKEGEPMSPLGEFAAQAVKEGYGGKGEDDGPHPYHGYYYRILTSQGKHAAGGAYSYLVNDHMMGGYALVAYPAEYGNSGIMSFQVDHDGTVFQKDLGEETAKDVAAMKTFDPDSSWKAVSE